MEPSTAGQQVEISWRSTYPVAFKLLSAAFYFAAIRKPRPSRLLLAPSLLVTIILSLISGRHLAWITGADSMWTLFMCIWILHSVSSLYIENKTPADGQSVSGDPRSIAHASYKVYMDPRGLHDCDERSSKLPRKRPGKPESRLRFSLKTVGKMLLIREMHVSIVSPAMATFSFIAEDFDAERQVYLRRLLASTAIPNATASPITGEETLLRAVITLHWIWIAYLIFELCHCVLALIFVLILRVDPPEEWPRLFGNPLQAWSIRRFWSKFWHSLSTRSSILVGTAVMSRIPGLREINLGSKPGKAVLACWIFLLSGFIHALADLTSGQSYEMAMLSVWFFVQNFVAGAFEALLVSVIHSTVRLAGTNVALWYSESRVVQFVKRGVGLTWVFVFLCWSVPKWQYPYLHAVLEDQNG